MISRTAQALVAMLAIAIFAGPALAQSQCMGTPSSRTQVRFDVAMGPTTGFFVVSLCDLDVEETVDNFLSYVDDGSYGTTGFIHRSVQGVDDPGATPPVDELQILQGGGFYLDGIVVRAVTAKTPIDLELAGLLNVRGTIAMARTSAPNSATSQWFVNSADNPVLDGNYAVFGEVVEGLPILDAMAALDTYMFNPTTFAETPVLDTYPGDGSSPIDYLVYITAVTNLPEPGAAAQAVAALSVLAGLARRTHGHTRPASRPAP